MAPSDKRRGLVKWMTVALATVMVSFGALATSFACDPAPHCWVAPLSEDGPDCLVFEYGEGWEKDVDACEWAFRVQNRCDEAIEIRELGCDDDCLAPVVLEPDTDATVEVRAPAHDASLEQTFGWTLGTSTGTFDVNAHHNYYEGDPCAGMGCSSAPGGPAPHHAAIAALLLAACLAFRRLVRPLGR